MKKTLVLIAMVAVGLLLSPAARADSWTLTLLPSGDISGPQGSTIGWGFTIDNLSSQTLLLTNLNPGVFQFATPNAAIFSFPTVDPNSALTVDYAPGTNGLYEITWDTTAPIGFVNSGTFVASALWCDPTLTTCAAAPDESAGYSTTVTGPVGVPEPATLFLLGIALAAVARKKFQAL